MRRWLSALALAAGLAVSQAAAATPDVDPTAAQQATDRRDWPQAITDWEALFVKGEQQAPSRLCRIYFDARNGAFDPSRVTDWCRRASANGDAWARYWIGLLYLVGLGVDRDLDQAQVLCSAAAGAGDPAVPAGFCLAAVAAENHRMARETLRLPAPPSQFAAEAAPAANCDAAFAAPSFDVGVAAASCRNGAAAGSAEALYRLGLMNLVGLGAPRNLDAAEADCSRAKTNSGGNVASDFCLAAVARLRQAQDSLAAARHAGSVDLHPETGLALPKTAGDPFALDAVLDGQRTTAGGLRYACRSFADWSVYEGKGLSILEPSQVLFGRRLVDYRPADFAALDQAVANCIKLAKPLVGKPVSLDPEDSLLDNLALFQTSIAALKTRQAELLSEERNRRQDAALIATVDRLSYSGAGVKGVPYDVTAQESVCIDRVTHAWQASGKNNGNAALEIRDTRLNSVAGRFVASGTANIVDANSVQHEVIGASMFRCTFDANAANRVANFQLQPGFAAAH